MKTISFITFAACVAASALMSSCSDEENTAASSGQLTAFTSGIVTEAPMTRVRLGASQSSTVAPGFLTRVSMERPAIGGKGTFFWESGDVIYVQDDSGKLCKSKSNKTDATDRTTFLVDGSYTTKGPYDVYYCGTKPGSDPKKVVIAATQTQEKFNDTKHFGASGDCGVAKAEKNTEASKSGYKFDLEHKVAYLCFLPYVAHQYLPANTKILSIEVTSNNNIAGRYDFTQGLLTIDNARYRTIKLKAGLNGFFLENKQDINNSLYMVVAPGTHTIKVRYNLFDISINKPLTIIKRYGSCTLAANTIYDIPVDLSMATISDLADGYNYYMWNADENYWFRHEWNTRHPWQPIENDKKNEHYPTYGIDDDRVYNNTEGGVQSSLQPAS